MKKTIFLLIALISSACSPQVTEPPTATLTPLPTQTPIPTPTLHPEFIELQNTINAKDGFVLTNDGTIEYNGVEVPDIKVTADGNYVLVVGEEMILLEPDEVTLDPEKGVVPDGYELNENDEWVEAVSPAMTMATDLLNQYGVDPETVTVIEEDSVVHVTDNETGKVLIRSNGIQNWFELGFAVDMIAANSCQPTEFRPSNGGLLLAEYAQVYGEYRDALLQHFHYKYQNGGPSLLDILIDRGEQCWGITDGKDLFFRDKDEVPHKLKLIALTKEEIREFQRSR